MFPEPHEIAIAAPAAGQGFTYQVEQAYTELVLGLAFTLVASAAVANRRALVTYVGPGGQTLFNGLASSNLTAGQTGRYSWQLGWPAVAGTALSTASFFETQLPILPLRPGGQVVVTVDLMDAADVISAPVVVVARRPVGQRHERAELVLGVEPAAVGTPGSGGGLA